jgi:tetratricopeptide (TPR) repeat protein
MLTLGASMNQYNTFNIKSSRVLLILSLLAFNHSVQASFSSQLPSEVKPIIQSNQGDILRAKKLDIMFANLKVVKSEQNARKIEQSIWHLWMNSDNRVVNQMMQVIMAIRQSGDYGKAINLLDDLIARYPNYSEGWNQRATIYYLMGNFEASVLDVAQTLKLEPRHFGALSGLAVMLWEQGNHDLARKSLREAVRIYPFLAGRDMFD